MSVSRLPSGRWRAQIHVAGRGNVSVSQILGGPGSFATRREAKAARAKARERIGTGQHPSTLTVSEFRERWLTDPLFARPKRSTMLHNAERTKAFNDACGELPITGVSDFIVAQYLAGGKRNSTVPALRAMFNDACSAKAGRVVPVNPFAGLGLSKGPGNRDRQPPSQRQLADMLEHARALTPPSFADYLEFGGLTAMRPSELDAFQWPQVDFEALEVDVNVQWCARTREFSTPKYGAYRIALIEPAKDLLLRLPREPFVFTTLRGTHYTASARSHHWNRVRCAAGLGDMTLYLATRHYFAWFSVNILGLDPAIVAEQLGHRDGGKLVERLYGHPDKSLRRAKIREAYRGAATVTPLRAVRKDAS